MTARRQPRQNSLDDRPETPSGARHAEEGQVLILFALSLFVLIGFVALSIDAGFLMAERRQAQNAADAGAIAAGIDLVNIRPYTEVQASGKQYGAVNADVSEDVVDVHWPPISGNYQGNIKYVQVIVTKDVQEFFVGAVYDGPWQVQASAVAGVELDKKPYALLALTCDNKNPGIYINGTTDVTINGGSIMANCSIDSSGGSNVLSADGTVDANGTIDGNSNWVADEGFREGVAVIEDPLKDTPPPPKGTAVTTDDLIAAGLEKTGPAWVCKNLSTCTLSPGYYNNLGEIQASGTIILSPGIYYFDGDTKLTAVNSDSWIKANGTLIYFAPTSTGEFKPSTANVEMSAPCLETTPPIDSCDGLAAYSGGANGMALWIANCSDFITGGNGVFRIEGAIYAPCSHVQLHGTPDSNGLQVIVGTLKLVGTSAFTINYREFIKADTPAVFLVE